MITINRYRYRSSVTALSIGRGISTRQQISSLSDTISDLFNSKKKKNRPDELDAVHFRVTRLNDTMAAARATLLDAMAGPAAGNFERSLARRNRTSAALEDLLKNVSQGRMRDDVALALGKFEEKETERKERLRTSLSTWRTKQIEKLDEQKKESFISKKMSIVSNMFRKDRVGSPGEVFGGQLKNETDLFKDLSKAGIDHETIESIVTGSSALMNVRISERKITENEPKYVHVLDFKGDTRASKAVGLSQEISAILSLPTNLMPSEVVLRLSSPGGTVTGYGRCSAELQRLTKAGLELTVCVDEVAASGGYLMASVAMKIYAAPFAAIGSIGVVASTPNVAKRMQDEGVSVIQSTAGKYKRTVTPWKEPSLDELDKLQEDVDTIQKHFVEHVSQQRGERIPDASDVATGEVWYGTDALKMGLVDELMTSEEYIQNRIEEGCEVIHIKKRSSSTSLSAWLSSGMKGGIGDVGQLNLPMLKHASGFSGCLEGADELESIADAMRLTKSLSTDERQALIKVMLKEESQW